MLDETSRVHVSKQLVATPCFALVQDAQRVDAPGTNALGTNTCAAPFAWSKGEQRMCDYSLHNVASRPANVGDELVTTEFVNAPTHGFAAVGEPEVAVCLLPGTEIAFNEDARYDHPFARLVPGFGFGETGEKVARFRRINPGSPNMHHDALEFASGQIVPVSRLCLGQIASVLQLPIRKAAEHGPTEQKIAESDALGT